MPLMVVGTNRNPFGSLEQFHIYKEEGLYYIYYCTNCVRNFETAEKAEECKFCHGTGIKQVFHKEGGRKVMHRFFCQSCGITLETNIKKTKCDNCGSGLVEMFRWNELNVLDHLAIRLSKSRTSNTRFFLPLPKLAAEKQRQ